MKYKNIIFGKQVREFRESRNPHMTQESLANAAGLRVAHLSDVERGVRPDPRLSTVVKILNALNVSFDKLMK
jgi:transcriptional regulator with XRE-family HTH domain